MEAAAEKMAALKKVYADIILNTAKESAARVLASERRALRSQQCLATAKEEALGTLLRLKSVMDSKIREAETASLGQLRKVQELEAQLDEAEDTICSLRTELKRVNNELAKMKNNIAEPFDGHNANGHVTSYMDKCQEREHSSDPVLCSPVVSGHMTASDSNTTLSQRTSEGHCHSVENAMQDESLKDLLAENEFASNPDLASIIMRSKDPELYRNGCTQRIRAFEKNLLTAKVPFGQSDDQFLNLKSDLVVCENGKVERPCSIDSAMADKIVIQLKDPTESDEIVKHDSSFGNGQVARSPRRARRKRRGRCNHLKSTNCGTFPDQDMADHKPSDTVSCEGSEDRKICPGIYFRQGSPGLLQCCKTTVVTRPNVTRQSHSDPENPISQIPPSSTENSGRDPLLLTDMKDCLLIGHAQNDAENIPREQVSRLTTPDQNVTENSRILLCVTNPETGDVPITNYPETSDVPITNFDVKDVSSGTAQAASNRFLKYTFQRKRKRGSSNSKEESHLLEKKSASKRTGDKQNALLEPREPSLIMELPRNNRRLVQVARQLISLSERRW